MNPPKGGGTVRAVLFFLATLFSSIPLSAQSAKPAIFFVQVGADCDVRERPAIESSIVGRVEKGFFVQFMARFGNAYLVEFAPGRAGYISGTCVTAFMDEAHVDETLKTSRFKSIRKIHPANLVKHYAIVDRDTGIYGTPGDPFEVIATVKRDEEMLITGFDGTYYRVLVPPDRTGFLTSVYVGNVISDTMLLAWRERKA